MNKTIQYITDRLSAVYSVSEARSIALWMAEETTGLSRTELLCKDTVNIPNCEIVLQRLLQQEPVQYVFGHTLWAGLDLQLTPDTLIPRPETAELTEWIIKRETGEKSLLDIGTGSGCIAIALKKHFPRWSVSACDISAKALEVARQNAKINNSEICFFQTDILKSTIDSHYDIIVSNPPYITDEEKKEMQPNVLLYEPHKALFVADSDPLLFYRMIAKQKAAHTLYFEINRLFGSRICDMLNDLGYRNIELRKDISGNDRMIRTQL